MGKKRHFFFLSYFDLAYNFAVTIIRLTLNFIGVHGESETVAKCRRVSRGIWY
jgi:hypothetical protein